MDLMSVQYFESMLEMKKDNRMVVLMNLLIDFCFDDCSAERKVTLMGIEMNRILDFWMVPVIRFVMVLETCCLEQYYVLTAKA